jgi:hypothetical protein
MNASRKNSAHRTMTVVQSRKILEMLVTTADRGCKNSLLGTACHAINSRISDLRKRGHDLADLFDSQGGWRYRLMAEHSERHLFSSFEEGHRKDYEREATSFAPPGIRT